MIISDLDKIIEYDGARYEGWSLDRIVASMRGSTLTLLKRGTMACLLARRELGGLLIAASKLLATQKDKIALFRAELDLDYSDACRHMKIWAFWPRIEKMLLDREESCQRRKVPFIVPGYRRCLSLAGLVRKGSGQEVPPDSPPPPVGRDPLPDDVEALVEIIDNLELQNRLEREKQVQLTIELDLAHEEIQALAFNASVAPERKPGWASSLTGRLFGRKRVIPPPLPDRSTRIDIRIGDCLKLIEDGENLYDGIVSDMPYCIGIHGYEWDSTDISYSADLWNRLFRVLKPGGYIGAFAAPRLYHRVAAACEAAGFVIHPFLGWRFKDGLPKPANLAELFDRDNLGQREVIGYQRGSGFTQANVDHGLQSRSHVEFAVHDRHVSEEAQAWRGYFFGKNALKPCMEPILLAQKPIATKRMIDNIRQFGTGALNIGALRDRYGFWPNTLFTHRKAERADHGSDHPSVKPLPLMEDLCTLLVPAGGHILDPFGGTGTTAVAAKNRGFDCTLIEQNPEMRPVIERRVGLVPALRRIVPRPREGGDRDRQTSVDRGEVGRVDDLQELHLG